MIKRIIFVFVLPLTLFAGIVRQEYLFDAPVINGDAIFMNGCRPLFMPLCPDLPVRSVALLLPDGERAVSYEVTGCQPVSLSGRPSLRAFVPEGRVGIPRSRAPLRKSAVFSTNSFFPGKIRGDGFAMQYKAGHPLFMARVNPVQYNPVTREIRYYRKISVIVTTEPDTGAPEQVKTTPLVRSAIAGIVDNREAAAILAATPAGPDDYEYLVITTDKLKNRFGTFIAFNARRGMRTQIITIETIRGMITGADDPEKIRAYIRQEWAAYNIGYVLLAGDDNAGDIATPNRIPTRLLYAKCFDYGRITSPLDTYTDDIPADMYYGCLDGTWKRPGSSHYGESGTEDLTFEVMVGRFAVDDTVQLANMISKTIRYSEQPVASQVISALFAGEYLWGPPDYGGPCYGDDELEQLIGTSSADGYVSVGFPAAWTISKLYGRVTTWLPADFLASMHAAKPAIIVHEGHANENILFKMASGSFTEAQFSQTGTPETGNYFIALSGGCYPGAFDNYLGGDQGPTTVNSVDCVGELLTSHMGTGAVACLFNSRFGWGGDGSTTYGLPATDGSEQRLRRYFLTALFGKGIHTIESANVYSKEQNASIITDSIITAKESYFGQLKWECYQKNLLGDPALSIWTAAPKTLSVTLPATLTEARFALKVPAYSTVALADPSSGAIFTSLTSDSTDSVVINNAPLAAYLTDHPQGAIKVIIKAHNCYPYSGQIATNVGIRGFYQNNHAAFRANPVMTRNQFGVAFTLASDRFVRLDLYDARGRVVQHNAGTRFAGSHTILFDQARIGSGLYCWEVIAGQQKAGGRFAVVK